VRVAAQHLPLGLVAPAIVRVVGDLPAGRDLVEKFVRRVVGVVGGRPVLHDVAAVAHLVVGIDGRAGARLPVGARQAPEAVAAGTPERAHWQPVIAK